MSLLKHISTNSPCLAVLVDPDKATGHAFNDLIELLSSPLADLILVGGSTLMSPNMEVVIDKIRSKSEIPIVLFPGTSYQLSPKADGILFLSLISGRNPEYLITRQVESAPLIRNMGLESIATGYILVGNDQKSAVSYVSQTQPIPFDQTNIIVATAIAGEMLGLQCIYLEAGSGAEQSISPETIASVKKNISIPLIVGGGIDSESTCEMIIEAGADMVVVGSALEKDPKLLIDLAILFKNFQTSHA